MIFISSEPSIKTPLYPSSLLPLHILQCPLFFHPPPPLIRFPIQIAHNFLTIIMEHDSCRDESPHSEEQHLVNIKDYSQHEESDREEEDSPFDELENILGQDENRTSRN